MTTATSLGSQQSRPSDLPMQRFKESRRAYGFDEVAIVPGELTINPELVELGLEIGGFKFPIPFMASAMDVVVDPSFAIAMHNAGGLAVLNLEGVWTRYDDPASILQEVASANRDEATILLQKAYQAEIRDDLIARRIHEIKDGGGVAFGNVLVARSWRCAEGVDRFLASRGGAEDQG